MKTNNQLNHILMIHNIQISEREIFKRSLPKEVRHLSIKIRAPDATEQEGEFEPEAKFFDFPLSIH